jgi:predicted lipid-binding transport protein (Tim44 family)
MWDQKNGKFPWKPGTPIFKCRDKECATNGGVIWEPKNGATAPAAAPPKSAPASFANKPESELPPFLRDAAKEDAAELAAKLAPDALAALQSNLAIYQALTEYVVRDIAPIYDKAKIGMSPESAAAAVATLYISANKK